MLPNYLRSSLLPNAFRWLLTFAVIVFVMPVYAQDAANLNVNTLSAQTMLVNFAKTIPNLMKMVTAFSYVMGMYFIFYGILKLKHFGEQRTMMSHEHGLIGPMILLAVGAMLLYLPTSVEVGLSTFWANPNPYGYQIYQSQWTQFLNDCFLIIQFVGTIAFIRGLVILSRLGAGGGGHQQGLGKGLTHIIGGIFCINIYQFVQAILATLGTGLQT